MAGMLRFARPALLKQNAPMLRRNVTQGATLRSEKSEERTARYRVIVPHWQVAGMA